MTTPQDRIIFNNPWELADYISSVINQAEAWKVTSTRLDEAHEYVKKYCMPDGWGRNVWHSILDDAIRLRTQLEQLKKDLTPK